MPSVAGQKFDPHPPTHTKQQQQAGEMRIPIDLRMFSDPHCLFL